MPVSQGDRPFNVVLDVRRVKTGDDLQLVGCVDVELSPQAPQDEIEGRVRFAFALEEDGRRGTLVPLMIEPPQGFVPTEGDGLAFTGIVARVPARFIIRSEKYRADWTGELLVEGEPHKSSREDRN
jgi:hypothetical protein